MTSENADMKRSDASQARARDRHALESHAMLRTMFEQGTQFAGTLSLDGRVTEVNRLALDGCGFRREDVVGKYFWECGWWNRSPEIMEKVRRATLSAAEGTLFRDESVYFLADGTARFVDLTIAPVIGDDGRVLFIAPTGRDITDQKVAEQALRESRQQVARMNEELRVRLEELQTLLKVLPVGVFVSLDPRCERITTNATGAAMLGIPDGAHAAPLPSTGELPPFRVFRGGVELPIAERPMERTVRTGLAVQGEEIDVVMPGRTRTGLVYTAPLFNDVGGIRGCLGAMVDITERKLAEKALEESREKIERQRRLYESVLNNTPDLAYIFDLNHRFIYANDVLLKMWGKTWNEAIGKNCLELGYEPWHAAMHDREIDTVVSTRQPIRGEVPFHGTFGLRHYDYIMVPVIGADGRVEAVAGTTRDVTDRKVSDEERESLLASERSARAEAERAGRLKEEFLATLSHELRTPLSAILGWIQILRKKTPSAESLEQGLAVIDRNARLQAQLIADLLDMSRIISGKMRMDVQRVELPLVIEAALEAIRPAAEAKEVRVQCVLDPITDTVHGDPTRLQQVVWNLLSNAVKFTPRGGRVQVVLARVNSHVELSVSDTGKGIKPEFLPYVFERFRQADSSAAREHGGLGLGLAIVKQLTELHGGTVRVSSAGEGQGATFVVHLPLAVMQPARGGTPDPRVHPQAEPLRPVLHDSPSLKGLRVLVVDDEFDARDLVRRVLEECDAEVILAASVDEGLAAVSSERPSVILSDIGMPERDGYEFMRTLRQSGVRVPAAALTAFARSEDRTRALHAGYQSHIAKPVEPAELLATVAALARMIQGERH